MSIGHATQAYALLESGSIIGKNIFTNNIWQLSPLSYILENKGEKSAYSLTEVSNPSPFLSKYPTAFTVISFPSCKAKWFTISDEKDESVP